MFQAMIETLKANPRFFQDLFAKCKEIPGKLKALTQKKAQPVEEAVSQEQPVEEAVPQEQEAQEQPEAPAQEETSEEV